MNPGENFAARARWLSSSVLRLAAALTLAFVATGLVGYFGYWAWTYHDRVLAKEAEAVRHWTSDLTKNLNMKARARTKLVGGVMFVALDFDGYPDFLKNPMNQRRGFHIRWEDADGFTRVKRFLALSDFSTRVDGSGKSSGLDIQFTHGVSLADYSKVASMSVEWTLDTEAVNSPPPLADLFLDDVSQGDHCAPGVSRKERLKRLARFGSVRETGLGEFTAGTHRLSLLSTGEVLSCR